jgi:hypothetical protein
VSRRSSKGRRIAAKTRLDPDLIEVSAALYLKIPHAIEVPTLIHSLIISFISLSFFKGTIVWIDRQLGRVGLQLKKDDESPVNPAILRSNMRIRYTQ